MKYLDQCCIICSIMIHLSPLLTLKSGCDSKNRKKKKKADWYLLSIYNWKICQHMNVRVNFNIKSTRRGTFYFKYEIIVLMDNCAVIINNKTYKKKIKNSKKSVSYNLLQWRLTCCPLTIYWIKWLFVLKIGISSISISKHKNSIKMIKFSFLKVIGHA